MTSGVPEVRYARSGDVNIAYQRFGSGRQVLVFVPPLVSSLDVMWELPETELLYRRAARVLDVIMFDKRGTGLSDRITDPAGFEAHAADLMAILDREEVPQAGLVGFSEGGIVALIAAALYPERVTRVVTQGTPVMGSDHETLAALADLDNPPPSPQEQAERYRALLRSWATPDSMMLAITAPSATLVPHIREWSQRYERQSASPGALRNHLRSQAGFDLRPYLDRVKCPTLVLHATHDQLNHVTHGRLLVSLLPDAVLSEFESDAHFWMLNDPNALEIQDQCDGWVLGGPPDRGITTAFASVLFTDIVDSTRQASKLGDHGWKQLVEHHDTICARIVDNHRGRVVKYTGDGLLATFPDPVAALAAATAMQGELASSGISIRAGLHVGQIELREEGDIAGIAVNIAARVEAHAEPGQILVSQTVRDMLMGTQQDFIDAGQHQLKGVEGIWRLYQLNILA